MADQELIARLKRIEGQARGIQRMIEDERDCRQILAQITAMRKATQQVGLLLARNYATQCLAGESPLLDVEDIVTLLSQAAS